MNYAAHINDLGVEQSVKEHSEASALRAAEYAEKISMSSLAKTSAIVHDFGKLCADFNGYIRGLNKIRRGEIDHSYAGAKYLYALAQKTQDRRVIIAAYFISRTVLAHHGLHDWINRDGDDCFNARVAKVERYNEICGSIGEIITDESLLDLLTRSFAELNANMQKIMAITKNQTARLFYTGMLERLVLSILMDADRTDTADFMYCRSTELTCVPPNLWERMSDNIEAKYQQFAEKTDDISKRRSDIADRCRSFANHKVGAVQLVVPTGGGKTLSSLRFAINYCLKNSMDRIIYIAPFMSILEQNSDIIKELVGDDKLFLEHHTNVGNNIENGSEYAEYELRAEKWDSPVIATTLVQFLNTLFKDKTTSVRRMHRLCRSVIIIDEVQSVPLKCVHLFNLAVNFLTRVCDSAVVLCSATQPTFEETEYPLVLDENVSMTGENYAQDFEAFRRNEIVNSVRSDGYTYEEAAEFAYEQYLSGGNLLFVVNTKSAAAHIHQYLNEMNSRSPDADKAQIVHLSTYMCPEHRRDALKKIKEMLTQNQRVICITTQLIEAGVDISFKCVIRSLAGLDNAAQAAGRCNRNGEYDICKVYIINITDEKLGRLREIQTAQSVTEQILKNEAYSDYLSADAMSAYFKKYYRERKDSLSYEVIDCEVATTLVDLLSANKIRQGIKKQPAPLSRQAFKTAGIEFEVIDENTCDILVPYNDEAKQLILRLNSAIDAEEAIELRRKAQKYTVSLYSSFKRQLESENALYQLFNDGIIALKDEFYDNDLGVKKKGGEMTLEIY